MSAEAPTLKLTAMKGSGFCNRNATVQASGIEGVLHLWEQVAASVPVSDEPLVIADYTASQSKNTMVPMKIAMDALRAKDGAERSVRVSHRASPG